MKTFLKWLVILSVVPSGLIFLWIMSAVLWPLAVVVFGSSAVILVTNVRGWGVKAQQSSKWRRVPWLRSWSFRTTGIILAVWMLASLGLGAAIYTAPSSSASTATTSSDAPTPTPAVPTPTPEPQQPTPTPLPQSVTMVDHSGTGEWTSPTFDAPGDWTLDYTYDCSNFGMAGNFQVYIYGPGNTPSMSGVNELQKSGSGSTSVHDTSGPGTYLEVNSECDWTVTAHS